MSTAKAAAAPRHKRRGGSDLRTGYLLLAPWLFGFVFMYLVPAVMSIYYSFTNYNLLSAPDWVGLDNYIQIFTQDQNFRQAMSVTFRYVFIMVPLRLSFALFVATLLNKKHMGMAFYRVLYYIPVLTSWVAASLIWKTVLSPQYGALNSILAVFGIQGPGWLLDEAWAMPAIVLVSVWKDMGFFGLILLSGLVAIDRTYYEAASIDGAGSFTKFTRITLPLLTPSIFYVLIVGMINAFQLFPQIMIMTDGGPNGATQVMVERIYKYGFRYYRMGYAAAFSWLLFIIIMLCTWLQMKGQKKWVNYDS